LTNTATVGIEDMQDQIKVTELMQNFPNPFDNETNIQFYLDSSEHVQFTIRDYAGREIIQLVNKTLSQGMHKLTWNGRNAAGSEVLNKILIGELKTGSYHKSIIMQKI
jgi:flagellar hook assembly protein FlgD